MTIFEKVQREEREIKVRDYMSILRVSLADIAVEKRVPISTVRQWLRSVDSVNAWIVILDQIARSKKVWIPQWSTLEEKPLSIQYTGSGKDAEKTRNSFYIITLNLDKQIRRLYGVQMNALERFINGEC